MLKNKSIIIVIIMVAIFLSFGGYILFQNKKVASVDFKKDGYILSGFDKTNLAESASMQYYFKSGTKYKASYSDKISFKDVNSKDVLVDKANFVHFTDGSISSLSNGVLLNINELGKSNQNYYNVYENTVLLKNSNGYSVDGGSGDNAISFSNILWKIGNDKYLAISSKIKVYFSPTEVKEFADYIEFSYSDTGVVTISNLQGMWQTISSESYIEFDNGTKINLETKNIIYPELPQISLAQMVISANDNIDISSLQKSSQSGKVPKFNVKVVNGKDGEQGENGDSGTSGKTGLMGNDGQNGDTIGAGGNDSNSSNPSTNVVIPPDFFVEEWKPHATGINAKISVQDTGHCLSPENDIIITIYNEANGNIVWTSKYTSGSALLEVAVSTLSPDNKYRLAVTASYVANDNVFTKDFVNKIFYTDSMGLSFTKQYATSDSIALKVSKAEYSTVLSAFIKIYDAQGNAIESIPEMPVDFNNPVVVFDSLNSNTQYQFKLINVVTSSFTLVNYGQVQKYMTLKKPAQITETPSFLLNKKNSSFKVQAQGVIDSDKGITKYRYELFEYGANVLTEAPVKTIEATNLDGVSFFIDDVTIKKNVTYVARVVAVFYDNEKYVDIPSAVSDSYYMDGKGFPIVKFMSNDITFEAINGVITIDPNGSAVDKSTLSISYQNTLGDINTYSYNYADITENAGIIGIPFNVNGLRKNDTYIITVSGKVDLDDGLGYQQKMIGNFIVLTNDTNKMRATFASQANANSVFQLTMSLYDDDASEPSTLEAATLNNLTFNLYATDGNTLIASKSVKDLDSNDYVSTVGSKYYNKTVTITESDFGLTPSALRATKYKIEVTNAYDYTKYKNSIAINNNTFEFVPNSAPPPLPSDINDAVAITRIDNASQLANDLGAKNGNLVGSTFVGFTAQAKYDNENKLAKTFTYHIFDAIAYDNATASGSIPTELYNRTVTVTPTDPVPKITILFGTGADDTTRNIYYTPYGRGRRYYVTYDANLDLTGAGDANYKYPQDYKPGTVLRSQLMDMPKEDPYFNLYPWGSATGGTASWKYKVKDVDTTISSPNFSVVVAGAVKSNLAYTTNYPTFGDSSFMGLTDNANYIIRTVRNLYIYPTYAGAIDLVNEYYEKVVSTTAINYTYTDDPTFNRIKLNFTSANSEDLRRLTALNVTAVQGGTTKTFVIPIFSIDTTTKAGVSYIPYSQLGSAGTWNFTISAISDSGSSGFSYAGSSTYCAIQNVAASNTGFYQIVNLAGNALTDNTDNVAKDSIYKSLTFTEATGILKYSDLFRGFNNQNMNLTFDAKGSRISGTFNYVKLKKLDSLLIKTGANNNFDLTIGTVIPSVNLYNSTLKGLDIVSSLTDVTIKFNIQGQNVIDANSVYIELCQKNTTTDNYDVVNDKASTIIVNNGTSAYSTAITNLTPKTDYAFKMWVNIGGTKYYLYDSYYEKPEYLYKFSTMQNIVISNQQLIYNATNYVNKTLNLNYDVNVVVGYKMLYDLYKWDNATSKYVLFMDNTALTAANPILGSNQVFSLTSNIRTISSKPTDGIPLGAKYQLKLTAVASADNTINLGSATADLDLTNIQTPTFGVTSTASYSANVHALTFKVTPIDIKKVMVGSPVGEYKVRFFDDFGNDITPAQYTSAVYDVNTPQQQFILTSPSMQGDTKYYLAFYAVIDKNNDNKSDVSNTTQRISDITTGQLGSYQIYKVSGTTLSTSNVSFGTINCVKNPSDSTKIRLEFYNSVNLTNVKSIQYSVYNAQGYSSSYTQAFIPTIQNPSTTSAFYTFDLSDNLVNDGTYYIMVQFFDASGNIIGEPVSLQYTKVTSQTTTGMLFFKSIFTNMITFPWRW